MIISLKQNVLVQKVYLWTGHALNIIHKLWIKTLKSFMFQHMSTFLAEFSWLSGISSCPVAQGSREKVRSGYTDWWRIESSWFCHQSPPAVAHSKLLNFWGMSVCLTLTYFLAWVFTKMGILCTFIPFEMLEELELLRRIKDPVLNIFSFGNNVLVSLCDCRSIYPSLQKRAWKWRKKAALCLRMTLASFLTLQRKNYDADELEEL